MKKNLTESNVNVALKCNLTTFLSANYDNLFDIFLHTIYFFDILLFKLFITFDF
jgi:hypothetical protein